jgi:hypothetical protein
MSHRHKHRVKVRISWEEVRDNPLGDWASKYLRNAIKDALPNQFNIHGCTIVLTEDSIDQLKLSENTRYTLEYEFRYKRENANARETEWYKIFQFCITMQLIKARSPKEMNVSVNVDLQANHFPWTFVDQKESRKVEWLAIRQGAKDYTIQLPEPIELPGHNRTRMFMSQTETRVTFEPVQADEIRIVGEPRCAYKVYKQLEQLERGIKVRSPTPGSKRYLTALPDLVTVLYRNTKGLDPSWQLLTINNNRAHGDYIKFILCGREMDRNPATKLDLDYSVYSLTGKTDVVH